jgi:hypothetical protein
VAVACSDGTMRDREFRTPGEARRYRGLQKKLARQRTGSANRSKTIAEMRRIKRRERDRRQDFVSWTGNRLATRHGIVVLEKLSTGSMTRSAKGTVEDPGRNVRQKAGLNRAILDKGWHMFELAVENVARRTGCPCQPAETSPWAVCEAGTSGKPCGGTAPPSARRVESPGLAVGRTSSIIGAVSTSTQTLPDVDTRDSTGDDTPKMFHYVQKNKIAESAVMGSVVVALCGEVFPVTRSPKPGSPVCPECKRIFESLPPGKD